MKTIYGYLILLFSFFGIIYLQNYVDYKNGKRTPVGIISDKLKQNSYDRRLKELELVVDSLTSVTNSQTDAMTNKNLTTMEKIEELLNPKQTKPIKLHFYSLNEAAKARDSKNELSSIAQQYINLAYEMGGDDWYGAEEIWYSDDFRNRIPAIIDSN